MSRELRGIEVVRYRVDWIRGLGALALFAFVAIASIYAGGWQGWAIGAAFLLLLLVLGGGWWLRGGRPPPSLCRGPPPPRRANPTDRKPLVTVRGGKLVAKRHAAIL